MIRSGLICLLFGALAWGQAAESPRGAPTQIATPANNTSQSKPVETPKVAPDAPVITINGLCDDKPADTAPASGCKVVFTREQFEAFADLVQPDLSTVQRRQLATTYADTLILAEQAQEMGLDKGPRFEELLKLQRLTLLRQLLNQALQEKVAQIPEQDVADYYQKNIGAYEEAQLQRLYVPLHQQLDPPQEKLTAAQLEQRQQDSDAAMKKEAHELHVRAVGGEDLAKLQDEAYQAAEIKTAFPPSKMQTYRRSDLSAVQAPAMSLKLGEISPVIKDANGYFFYKAGEKTMVPLDKVRPQIISMLRSQRLQQYMKAALQSATTILNEEYFTGTSGAGAQGISVPSVATPRNKVPGAAE
jgi:PPIC-type PPIASE domain